ncbi:MAG: type I phosphomannose isomerase catalytic subunit [Planctomycetaceae bacterium]
MQDNYAESWEISDLPEQQSEVATGPHAGWTLSQLIEDYKADLLGASSPFHTFPLLIKFLDIQDKLSVQVHPDDHLALQLTEASGRLKPGSFSKQNRKLALRRFKKGRQSGGVRSGSGSWPGC